ncbi:MAG: hypothetical protein Q7R73_00190 [bacterium]|nr:hypothetical protein [bacterium]
MVELIFLAIFLISLSGMVFLVWKKMPLLRTVPDQLIEESFVTRPSYVDNFLSRVKARYQERYHHYLVFSFLERLIVALRDIIAYAEQGLFWLLRHVQDRQNGNGSSKRVRYLNRLHAWKKKNRNGLKQDEEDSSSVDGLLPPQ